MFVRKVVIEELSLRSSWWADARGVAPPETSVPRLSRLSRWSHLRTGLTSSVLPSIDLRHGHLAGVDLSRSDLSSADLSRSDFEAANFTDTSLVHAATKSPPHVANGATCGGFVFPSTHVGSSGAQSRAKSVRWG
ncbi:MULTISPECIES: pentapeptide repeat-containing protein [unclassified Rhodococcus (in: high G+C Gram-positive bacteria)]|uniref:pentapeptide repeat-containing protein n=1 Tax=Rhodococcus sp. SJ-3 TaxID=3454628 RepID=UPI003F799143